MDFRQIEQQANMIGQHNANIVTQLQQVAGGIQNLEIDDAKKQEIIFALRELALSVKGLNQETTGLVQNSAIYIQQLESNHPHYEQYQQNYPQQYQQYQQPTNPLGALFGGGRSGGFWSTILQTAEMGAGFEIGRDVVDDIFNIF